MGYLRWLLLFIMILTLLPAGVASADTISDADITFQSIHAYRNLLVSGDMAIIFHWRWSSTNTSSTPASSAVLATLSYDDDVVASATPYVFSPFDDNGYGDSVIGFYLTSGNWSSTLYSVTIAGLPIVFGSDPPYKPYSLEASEFATGATQEENQEALRIYILNLCDIFRTIYPDVGLKAVQSGSTVLSDYGETFFRSTIPGLQFLCPRLFIVQSYVPAAMEIQEYNTSKKDAATAKLTGTDLKRGADRLGDALNTSGAVAFALIMVVGMGAILIACHRRGWGLEISTPINIFILAGMALLVGDLLFTLLMIAGFIAVIGLGYIFAGKRV